MSWPLWAHFTCRVLQAGGGKVSIWRMRKLFSSVNCSSSVRSAKKPGRNLSRRSRFCVRILLTASDLCGFATKTSILLARLKWQSGPDIAYFEYVEPLVLHHFSVVPQQIHTQLQVISSVNVCGHDIVVCPIEEDLSQQLDRLPLRNVRARFDQDSIVLLEEEVKVGQKVLGDL